MKPFSLTLIFLLCLSGFINAQDFEQAYGKMLEKYTDNGLVDYASLKEDGVHQKLADQIAEANLDDMEKDERLAFLINAYNLLVIYAVAEFYPLSSVQDVLGFFDRKRYVVAGESITLNQLEKEWLLKKTNDPRLHFALVCGANGCPPLLSQPYTAQRVEAMLESQTRRAINNPAFVQLDAENGEVSISRIFQWYAGDFGEVRSYINRYRNQPIPEAYTIRYYEYDWSLNDQQEPLATSQPTNASRYVVSSTVPKGRTETKIFNNLYTQRTRSMGEFNQRSTFSTTFISFLYGTSNRLNVGFDARYRLVRNGLPSESPLQVYGGEEEGSTRRGFTTIGPKIRWAPVPQWSNFSVQSAFWFPIGDELEEGVFIDWNGPTWWTQFFNDFSLGQQFSLFTEVDFLWEDIGGQEADLNRISTPATLILSYFPTPKASVYWLNNYSPFWQEEFDYFFQSGFGAKYQFTPNFELELLGTLFRNKFLLDTDGQAATYNLGIRFNL
jgi:hypothetical protein